MPKNYRGIIMTNPPTHYNPLLRATRAAFAELTTPEAWHWYAQQLQTGAALAQTLTRRSITTARHLLNSSKSAPTLAAVVKPEQADSQSDAIATAKTTTSAEPIAMTKATETEQSDTPAEVDSAASDRQGIELIEDGAFIDLLQPATGPSFTTTSILRNGLSFIAESVSPSSVVDEPAQAKATAVVPAEAAELEPETTPSTEAAPETNGSAEGVDYKGLEHSNHSVAGAEDESTSDDEIPSDDELECGPPLSYEQEDEDPSFYLPDDDQDADDSQHESTQPSDLASLIQKFLQQKESALAEATGVEVIAHPSHTPAEATAELQMSGGEPAAFAEVVGVDVDDMED
jgi:hypothetical protein